MRRNRRGWEHVAVFENFADGKVLETFLREYGLEARTNDDKLFRYFLFLRPPRITYRVQVHSNDLTPAMDLVNSANPPILEKAFHCPACGSLRINYPQMTRKFFLPTVLLHLGIIFHIVEHQCYCDHCHEMWNLPATSIPNQATVKSLSP